MLYTNRSAITKTFHGVTFRPGETKEVFGVINDPKMAISSTQREPPKCVRSTSSESKVDPTLSEKPTRRRTSKLVEPDHVQEEPHTSDPDNSENTDNKEVIQSGDDHDK